MIKLVILYAPEDAGIRKFAEGIQKAFDKKSFKVSVKSAFKSHISDIAAADAVILGSKTDAGAAIHPDFAELVRAFSGVNLSGRSAAFFCEKASTTAQEFADSLIDSEITVFEEALVFQDKSIDVQKLKRWASQFSSFIKKNIHE